MDTLVTLNLVGYAAVLAGGLVLGTLFGRTIASDLGGIVHSLESRVLALETTLHVSAATASSSSSDAATAAIKSHAEATEKLAAAIQTQTAAKPASN
jgi:hypothetical protein